MCFETTVSKPAPSNIHPKTNHRIQLWVSVPGQSATHKPTGSLAPVLASTKSASGIGPTRTAMALDTRILVQMLAFTHGAP